MHEYEVPGVDSSAQLPTDSLLEQPEVVAVGYHKVLVAGSSLEAVVVVVGTVVGTVLGTLVGTLVAALFAVTLFIESVPLCI